MSIWAMSSSCCEGGLVSDGDSSPICQLAAKSFWSDRDTTFNCDSHDSLRVAEDGLTAAFEGRLDECRGILAVREADLSLAAIEAYRRKGIDFADSLVGDFCGAIWDSRRRQLVLACDPGGLRPIYFAPIREGVIVATDLNAMLADPRVPRRLDERHLANWLCLAPSDPLATFFLDIRRVPPGSVIVWSDGKFEEHRYWQPEMQPFLRLPSDGEYIEALLTCFSEAVRCRMPGEEHGYGVYLSGGLDSTSVMALVASHAAASSRSVTAFTAVPSHPPVWAPSARFPDESEHARAAVARYRNVHHRLFESDHGQLFPFMSRRVRAQCAPPLAPTNVMWIDGIMEEAQQKGIRTMFVGDAGNITISYSGDTLLPGLWRQRRYARLITEIANQRRAGRRLLSIARETLDAHLPYAITSHLRNILGRQNFRLTRHSLVNPAFLAELHMAPYEIGKSLDLANQSAGHGPSLRSALLARSNRRGIHVAGSRRLFGIETCDPTLDRRVVELCLAIPDEQFRRQGVSRSLIRRAMAGLLPDSVLSEPRRGLQGSDWNVSLELALPKIRSEVQRLASDKAACRYFDVARMQRMIDAWPRESWNSEELYLSYNMGLLRALSAANFLKQFGL